MHEPYLHWHDWEPRYKTKNTLGIDIAVIKVLKAFIYNDIVMGACLPTEPVQPGSACFASGWGTTTPFIWGDGQVNNFDTT